MTQLLAECEHHDIIRTQEALDSLCKLTDNYGTLIRLYTIKIFANDPFVKLSNADRDKLLNMYDEIYLCFKNNEINKGREILNEAWDFIDDKNEKIGKTVKTVLKTNGNEPNKS